MESAPKIETCYLEDWQRDKNHRRRPRKYKFEFSYVGNDRRRTQKSGTRRENRNAFYLPDSNSSPTIPDNRGCLRFMVFISRQNLGWSGNCEIPDRLGFSRHMKTRLYGTNPVSYLPRRKRAGNAQFVARESTKKMSLSLASGTIY